MSRIGSILATENDTLSTNEGFEVYNLYTMANKNFEAVFRYRFLYWKAILWNVLLHIMVVRNSGYGSVKDGGR